MSDDYLHVWFYCLLCFQIRFIYLLRDHHVQNNIYAGLYVLYVIFVVLLYFAGFTHTTL